ncbi:type II toxin-antitoxin system HipA family toxin [Kocuria rosea]|uniref:type II toxin-antitoxin system HipA family toxin n=1 Tax=Kocuria rosea TaxID=1275 RepID=UPI0025B79824|nr:type II toxin-antitoxin system HipA family toxin [Kocuria rosea]WJZ68358.1 type II toxin-antitoxin system HipA family toxin [Kocuria rosea]
MKELLVLLHQQLIGVLQQSKGGARTFQYLEGVPIAGELSLALPYRLDAYPPRKTNPFIEGLLPEGAGVREAMGRQFEISPTNPFALLEHIGLECAGAVQFVHPDELDNALSGEGALTPYTEVEIGRRLRALGAQPQGSWVVTRERWSLAGAQSKFALRMEKGRWYEASGAEPTTHIIKPGIHDFQDQALNEHLCLHTLDIAGLSTARTQYVEFDGSPAIVIERYDRHRDESGIVRRIHQEDFCQATSTLPHRKYESNKGPNALTIIKVLREAEAAEEEVNRFIDGLIGNYLLGAPDAHAKNYSVILAPGITALAPFYDVASGLPYRRESHDEYKYNDDDGLRGAAMAIGGQRRFGRISRRHWLRFAQEARVNEDWLLERVKSLAEIIPEALDHVIRQEKEAIGDSELPNRLLNPVRHLCETTLTQLEN